MSSITWVKFNPSVIIDSAVDALEQMGAVYAEETKTQITSVKWDWPNGTVRKVSKLMGGTTTANGCKYIPAGKRDIVDTGALLDSQTEPEVTKAGNSVSLKIAWTAPYSLVVLLGGDYGSYVSECNGGKLVNVGNKPARNWIVGAYREKPPLIQFANAWKNAQ